MSEPEYYDQAEHYGEVCHYSFVYGSESNIKPLTKRFTISFSLSLDAFASSLRTRFEAPHTCLPRAPAVMD